MVSDGSQVGAQLSTMTPPPQPHTVLPGSRTCVHQLGKAPLSIPLWGLFPLLLIGIIYMKR